MKKVILYLILVVLALILFLTSFIILGICVDLFNYFMLNSLFAPFYKSYGISWQWDLWHYILLLIVCLAITTNVIKTILNKLKGKYNL